MAGMRRVPPPLLRAGSPRRRPSSLPGVHVSHPANLPAPPDTGVRAALRDRAGQALSEYALLVGAVAALVAACFLLFSTELSGVVDTVGTNIGSQAALVDGGGSGGGGGGGGSGSGGGGNGGSSAEAPGHGSTPPGHGGTPPGLGENPPGLGGTPPGQGGSPPGKGGRN